MNSASLHASGQDAMNKHQIIVDEAGQPAYAVIPWPEYKRLVSADNDTTMTDEELYDLAKAAGDESFPAAVVDRLLAGESPIKVYRDHRGRTQKQLANAAGINAVYLSQIETGKRTGSAKTLASIAGALDVDVDDLI